MVTPTTKPSELNEVLISGAGIAGNAFAFWLLRVNPEVRITILEKDRAMRLTGASVDIKDAAVDVMRLMGLEDEILKHCTNEIGADLIDSDGRVLTRFPRSYDAKNQSFTSEYEIFRGAMAQVFVDAVKKSDVNGRVKWVFGDEVVNYRHLENGKVEIDFANAESKEYDLLVAADGVGSRIRTIMLNCKSRDYINASGVFGAYFTVKKDLIPGNHYWKWYNTTRGRIVMIRPDTEGQCRGFLVNVTANENSDIRHRLRKALKDGHDEYKAILEEEFRDAGWLAPQVLDAVHDCDDFYASEFLQVEAPKLASGRVVLLGDAGYGMMGVGTSNAMTFAYVLAGELLKGPGNIEAALSAYEGHVLSCVPGQRSSDPGAFFRWTSPQSQWGINVRNSILMLFYWLRLFQILSSLASWLGVAEKPWKLPDYHFDLTDVKKKKA